MLLLPIGVYLAPPTVQQFCFLEYYNDFTLFFILMLGSLRLAGIVILFTGLRPWQWRWRERGKLQGLFHVPAGALRKEEWRLLSPLGT